MPGRGNPRLGQRYDPVGRLDNFLKIGAAIKALKKVIKERGDGPDGKPDMEPDVPDYPDA
jgi:hypothetical protein